MFRARAEGSGSVISAIDRLFLERTYELAARGIGNTSPNPPVGAVVARGETMLGEGYHHRAGEAHAEVNALADAGDARGATMYVSLEPCLHVGRTPPCTNALRRAGIARVVIGALDPTRHGGAAELARDGLEVAIANDPEARKLIEIFTRPVARTRAYVTLKMAMSLDGYVASRPGTPEWISCEEERLFVRDLRVAHDAVMVGAGTVRIDDPQLTVRPPASRLREFVRIVACANDSVPPESRVFAPVPGYARTVVLAPGAARARFRALEDVADVLYVGESQETLDIKTALEALRERGITSVLCEGGPTLAGDLIARGLVDRFYWAISPVLLHSESAVSVLGSAQLDGSPRALKFDMLERLGCDALIGGTFADV
jgi:diaminohydroxyphosphoribosylaminopyrimidine deaminase / 5-amino-6-(5-phosphoribosylamino)uracil reductase